MLILNKHSVVTIEGTISRRLFEQAWRDTMKLKIRATKPKIMKTVHAVWQLSEYFQFDVRKIPDYADRMQLN